MLRRWGLGCLVVVLLGAAAWGWSTLPVIPDCDGLTMGPGDSCIVYDGRGMSARTYSYEESLAGERRGKELAETVGPVLVAGGVLAFSIGVAVSRHESLQWREGKRGPDAVVRRAAEAGLGEPVATPELRGDRRLHLFREGLVVERHDRVEDVVAWREVDAVHDERRCGEDGGEWVQAVVLVTGGRRVTLRAHPGDRSSLGAVVEVVNAARARGPGQRPP